MKYPAAAVLLVALVAGDVGAQNPRAAASARAAVMTLTSRAFGDGDVIPAKYTQAGEQVSPDLTWTGVPAGVKSFVLVMHDIDVASGPTGEDVLHWLVWNIPADVHALPEGVPAGAESANGMRQLSVSGPQYRGPGAGANGPLHHYVFELYALDTMIDVPAAGLTPSATRAAVIAAMTGHIKGKGVLVGRFKRPSAGPSPSSVPLPAPTL